MTGFPVLELYVGSVLIGFSRLRYTYDGDVTDQNGALELQFEGGGSLLLNVGGDGESLTFGVEAYEDPFVEPLSPDNEKYVRTHGKWEMIDATHEMPYSQLIGKVLREYRVDSDGVRPIGLKMVFDDLSLKLSTEGADELFVAVLNNDIGI